MRLVIIALISGFVAVVIALIVIYAPAGGSSRVTDIENEMQPGVTTRPRPPAAAPTSANPQPAGENPGQTAPALEGAAAPATASDAAANLKDEHLRENTTQFDRSLDFLAPAAAAPMIENPIATASAATPLPESSAVSPVPVEARNWRGVVLVPKNMLLATAHTARVRIPRIEAHPLDDGNVRIWARIQNPSSEPLKVGVACTFRYAGQPAGVSRGFLEIEIPAGGYYDADFLSPHSGVETYTILVKSN